MQLTLVESKFLAFQNVAVAATRLAGTAGDDGVQTTSLELLLDGRVDFAVGSVALSLLLLDRFALLHFFLRLALLGGLGLLTSTADWLAVMSLVPLSERRSVDLDDGASRQGVGTDEFVVGRVVGDRDDTSLAGAALGGPGKVTRVQTQSTVLVVAAASADGVNALGADTRVGTLAASFESALLPCWQKRSERMLLQKGKDNLSRQAQPKGEGPGRRREVLQLSKTHTGFRVCFFFLCVFFSSECEESARTVIGTLGAGG